MTSKITSTILEAYLNEIYMGQDGAVAIHGIGRAAQFYFGKDVSQMDVGDEESARARRWEWLGRRTVRCPLASRPRYWPVPR